MRVYILLVGTYTAYYTSWLRNTLSRYKNFLNIKPIYYNSNWSKKTN